MIFGKKYTWLQMVMWLGIDQWAWTMNIWHILNVIFVQNYRLNSSVDYQVFFH